MATTSPATVQKLLSFGSGIAAAGVAYVSIQRLVWRGAADVAETYGAHVERRREEQEEMFFGPKTRALAVRSWNKTIDDTVGSFATYLAKRTG